MIEEVKTNKDIDLNIKDNNFNLEMFLAQLCKYQYFFTLIVLGIFIFLLPQTTICML